jgi:DNA repair protein SbcD/Mre11
VGLWGDFLSGAEFAESLPFFALRADGFDLAVSSFCRPRLSNMSSSTFRFIHAADLHLDVPFHGLRCASPAVTLALGQAAHSAWDALVQLTIDQNAAFLLISGDICDGGDRGIPAQLRFFSGLQRLSAHGIRTFIARGANDPADRWTAIHRWPEGAHCFGAHAPESIAVRTAGGHFATVHGISCSNDRLRNRVARFRRGSDPGVHIAVVHGNVRTADLASEDFCSVADLQAVGMDYWALGHDHRYRLVSEGHPWIVYPGTLQGRSLKGEETGPKGAVVVTVSGASVVSATHHPLDAVRLMRPQVDASTVIGPADFRRALAQAAARIRSECTARTVIASAELTGRRQSWMGAQYADGVWDRVLEEIRQEENGGDMLVWWDSLIDLTDASASGSGDDASSYIHGLVEVFRRAPAGLDRLLADQNGALGPAMSAGHPAFDPIEVNDLLSRAERVALSLLEPRES